MRNMWCNIHSQLSLEESWGDLHGSEAICMWNMWSNIQPQLSLVESCSDPHGVKPFACKIGDLTFNHSFQFKSHVATHMEWRHFHEKYVMQHSSTIVTWRVMKRPTWSEAICMWNLRSNIQPQLSLAVSLSYPDGSEAICMWIMLFNNQPHL